MSERIIHTADLSAITSSLRGLSKNIKHLRKDVEQVDDTVQNTRQELYDLQTQFEQFLDLYNRTTQVNLAETRLIKLRQELETKFGHHDEVRRAAVGILQASDLSIVHTTTMQDITEELMMLTPVYWLAPALVALAAWMRDDQPLAQRALGEALRRDDEKTSLFFALILRRAGRTNACGIWLDRFLGEQNPKALKRQSIVLINIIAGGVFPPNVQQLSIQRLQGWLETLAEQPNFVEDQRAQWRAALFSKIPQHRHGAHYPHLEKFCTNWTHFDTQLNRASLYRLFLKDMQDIFERPLPSAARLSDEVDELLSRLVTDHDAPERPLRLEEGRLEAIIKHNGQLDAAQRQHQLEQKAFSEEVSFTQLLTNAAMHAQHSGASPVTQRLAFALSRDWIRDAFSDLTFETRHLQPQSAQIQIGDWSGETRDGTEEKELHASLEKHVAQQCQNALEKLKFSVPQIILAVLGMGLLGVSAYLESISVALMSVGLLIWSGYLYFALEKKRILTREAYERRRADEMTVLDGCLAEYVEWLRAYQNLDAKAPETRAYIEAISPDAHLSIRAENARRLMPSPH